MQAPGNQLLVANTGETRCLLGADHATGWPCSLETADTLISHYACIMLPFTTYSALLLLLGVQVLRGLQRRLEKNFVASYNSTRIGPTGCLPAGTLTADRTAISATVLGPAHKRLGVSCT